MVGLLLLRRIPKEIRAFTRRPLSPPVLASHQAKSDSIGDVKTRRTYETTEIPGTSRHFFVALAGRGVQKIGFQHYRDSPNREFSSGSPATRSHRAAASIFRGAKNRDVRLSQKQPEQRSTTSR
jgi:hypothetical protein